MKGEKKLKIAVLFGGASPEHEVSIITGIQVMHALDKRKYDVIPVYATKDRSWILGDKSYYKAEMFKNLNSAVAGKSEVRVVRDSGKFFLKGLFFKKSVDVFFPAFHGRYGEDGTVQGFFELIGVPYVGCDVETSSIGMDKLVSKRIAAGVGIPVLKDYWLQKGERPDNKLQFPVFVKPARLGSSIGITKACNKRELAEALDVAFFYDTKVMVEKSLERAKEVNISIIGNKPYEVSVTEQPVSSSEILSFEDKYTSNSGKSKGMASSRRIIPAPIKNSTRIKIENYTKKFFAEIGGQGIARIDFLLSQDEKEVYFNEINTMPGSVAFYLWEKSKLPFHKLVDKLIKLALKRSEEKRRLITTYKSNILEGFKGVKGDKS